MNLKLCANCGHRATRHKRRRSEGSYWRFHCSECKLGESFCDEFRLLPPKKIHPQPEQEQSK